MHAAKCKFDCAGARRCTAPLTRPPLSTTAPTLALSPSRLPAFTVLLTLTLRTTQRIPFCPHSIYIQHRDSALLYLLLHTPPPHSPSAQTATVPDTSETFGRSRSEQRRVSLPLSTRSSRLISPVGIFCRRAACDEVPRTVCSGKRPRSAWPPRRRLCDRRVRARWHCCATIDR